MEVIDRTEKRSSIVDLVNPLIEEAFGKGFRGNYDYAEMSTMDGPSGLKEVNGLGLIGRKRMLGFVCEYAGQLGTRFGHDFDGSVIAVFPRYETEAKRYAELYEKNVGKPVKIILTDIVSPADKSILGLE